MKYVKIHKRDFLISLGCMVIYPFYKVFGVNTQSWLDYYYENDGLIVKTIKYQITTNLEYNEKNNEIDTVGMIDIKYNKGKQKIVFSGKENLVFKAYQDFQKIIENKIKKHNGIQNIISILQYEVELNPVIFKFDCSNYELYRKDVNKAFEQVQKEHKEVNIEEWVDHK